MEAALWAVLADGRLARTPAKSMAGSVEVHSCWLNGV